MLAELNQSTSCGLGMQETDVQALGTTARSCVNHAAALLLNLVQGTGNTILNAESNVLDTTTATILLNKLGNGAFGSGSLKQFNLGLTTLEEGGLNLLVCYFLNCIAFQTQHVLIERDSFLKRGDCDTHMLNVRNLHN